MKPIYHANISVKKHGGSVEDYLPIHDFMDSSKACLPDVRHRAILHSSFGIFIAEKVFGHTITNSDGKIVCVRDITEEHILEDLGSIPTVERWLTELPIADWMLGTERPLRKENEAMMDPDIIPVEETVPPVDVSALTSIVQSGTRIVAEVRDVDKMYFD